MIRHSVENARVRAIAFTKPSNQSIGAAIHIADNETYNNNNPFRGELQEIVVIGYSSKGKRSVEPPNIEFERIKVATNINVKFILKP